MDLRKRREQELKREKKKSLSKRLWTAFGALLLTTIITTLAVDATDNAGNFSRSIIGSAVSGVFSGEDEGPCPAQMALVSAPGGDFCIDRYEVSAGEGCLFQNPQNQNETTRNLENNACEAVSASGKVPWTNIARHQAELACANAGKHLPTNSEWYVASLGTPDSKAAAFRNDCNVSGGSVSPTGEHTLCISSHGVNDMVGNVWEWVSETVVEGSLEGRPLPDEGYVTSIDTDGVAITTNASTSDSAFADDYIWILKEGVRGMIRGGYYGNGTDAGQYAINAVTPTSFTGSAVGFRCAK